MKDLTIGHLKKLLKKYPNDYELGHVIRGIISVDKKVDNKKVDNKKHTKKKLSKVK